MPILAAFCWSACATTNTSNSGNSSQSNSSANGGSSQGSGASSEGSSKSSDTSNQSSQASSNGSRNSSNSNESSKNSTNGTTDSPSAARTSQIAVGSALLTAVAGGIVTTVYAVKWRRQARLQEKQLQQLQRTPLPPPPPPQEGQPPGFVPTPFPEGAKGERDAEPTIEAMMQARAWLLANELQFRQDLALGAGPTIDDLSGLAGVTHDHRARFGVLLQRHADEFLVAHDVTPREAAAAMARLGDLVMGDPVLRLDGEALVASW